MDVRTLLKEKGATVYSVRPDETVDALVKVLRRNNIGACVVQARFGEVLGIVSERDVVRALAADGAAALQREVHELMTYRTVSCRPTDDLGSVMAQMNRHNIRHLPVVDNGNLEGMVSIRDVNRVHVAEMELERSVLREYAQVSQTALALR